MNEYLLNITNYNTVYKLYYSKGKFKKLEHVSGKLPQLKHESLLKLAPQLEEAILILRTEYSGAIEWVYIQKKQSKSLFSELSKEYIDWYQERFKIKPKFTGIEGNALKQIIKHLEEQCFGDEEQVKAIWNAILSKWNEQNTFYQGQIELRQINSNLNIILRTIKYGKSATEKGEASAGGNFREKL